ncbi:MAG: hypothetical protein KIT79_05850 [Deltaproteobacteria bacterium]|nr:hypothetical protein [Deltaproteobacteria bacterium]
MIVGFFRLLMNFFVVPFDVYKEAIQILKRIGERGFHKQDGDEEIELPMLNYIWEIGIVLVALVGIITFAGGIVLAVIAAKGVGIEFRVGMVLLGAVTAFVNVWLGGIAVEFLEAWMLTIKHLKEIAANTKKS